MPLSADEKISLRHLREYLGGFDRYIIGEQELPKELSDFALRRFPAEYFTDRYGYNRLLLSAEFYRAFARYEYVLVYQLDCLVFGSNLEEWCEKEWDYVGAPWLKNPDCPDEGFSAVGNGGLSLRRVDSALRVLRSRKLAMDPRVRGEQEGKSRVIFERLSSRSVLTRSMRGAKTLLHRTGYHNNARWLAQHFADLQDHEDTFWAFEAPRFASFRIPEPQEALAFAFEVAPRYCLKANSGLWPWGCHAWAKHDREFWEPMLLK